MDLNGLEVPKSWKVVKLGNFVEHEKGKKPKKQQDQESDLFYLPYIDIQAFEKNNIRSFTDGVNCRLCSKEDFLMVWDGSRSGLVGKGMDGALGSTLVRINFPLILNDYAFYFLQSKFIQINSRAKGVGIPHVDPNLLWNYEFPIPPENEQHRIVNKIESLFSKLDKGIESLKTAREQLKLYRQALLKHAFEGKLTAQWRTENADKLESAETLLARIKEERENRYQQQLQDWEKSVKQWEAKGKDGKKPSKPRKLKTPEPILHEELSQLPKLPLDWSWVKLGDISWSVKDGPHYSPKYSEEGIPFITGGNVRPSGVDFNNVKYISKDLHDELCKRCRPEKGNVLYTKGGTTGIARVNTYDKEFNVWVHVAVLKIVDSITPFFLQHALNSPFCYSQSQKFTHGVGNQDLGLTRMVNIVLPICDPKEQLEVVKIVDSSVSMFNELDSELEISIKKSQALRQSILKKAFSGKLVSQDLNDEPASELLKRIAAEKAQQAEKAKQMRKKASVKKTQSRLKSRQAQSNGNA